MSSSYMRQLLWLKELIMGTILSDKAYDADSFQKQLLKAMEYALHIIDDANKFIDFAIALTDYMGEDFIPYCKMVYDVIRYLPDFDNQKLDDYHTVSNYSLEQIKQRFYDFQKEQEQREREKEFKENIDELQFLVRSYRNSEEFKKMLDFVGKFKYMAPYNAMLVQMQKPGATFVFTGKIWAKYGRRPTLNSQKLIILKPFGPVQCVFDYSDTEPIPNVDKVVDETVLMEDWNNGLMKANGSVQHKIMDTLCNNLPVYGIYLDDNFLAANTYGGYIMPYSEKKLSIRINGNDKIQVNSRFVISINKNQKDAVKFHTICHELGHLFCYHQCYNPSKHRSLTLKEREFEAETVAWIVCKRHGIENPSEEYLASYAPHGEIPICSTDIIMKAVTEIEKMLKQEIKIKDSLWYKEDRLLQKEVTQYLKVHRAQKDLFGNPISI